MPSFDSLATPEREVAIAGQWNSWRSIWVVLFAAGMLLAWFVQRAVHSAMTSGRQAVAIAQDRFDVTIPNAQFTPEQVVSRQIESLRAAIDDNEQLIECYSFAAPSNRAATGPFDNFSALVRTEPYVELALCAEYQVGAAVIDGTVAAVLVSLLTEQDQSLAFRFVLVKQSEAPYAGCWMTEGVFHLVADETILPSEAAAAAANDAQIDRAGKTRGAHVD